MTLRDLGASITLFFVKPHLLTTKNHFQANVYICPFSLLQTTINDTNIVDVIQRLSNATEMANETDQIGMNFDVVVMILNSAAVVVDEDTPLEETVMVCIQYSCKIISTFIPLFLHFLNYDMLTLYQS